MAKTLYTKQDNVELNEHLSTLNDKIVTESKISVTEKEHLDDSNNTSTINLNNNELFNDIKDIFTNQKPQSKVKIFFTQKKGAISFNIDNTIFTPNPMVCLNSKRFEDKYLQQLESYIFNNEDELNPDNLITLIYITDIIQKGLTPITIVTGKYRYLLPKIISVLNKYFRENYSVLFSIYTMFNGTTIFQKQKEENAAK